MARKVKENGRGQHRREPGRTTVSSKNQITIPVMVLREAGVVPGTRLEASVNYAGEIVLRNVDESAADRIRRAAGGMDEFYPDGYLEDLRKDWDGRP